MPSQYADYTIYGVYCINQRFDYFKLQKEHQVGSNYVQIEDVQYWIYDKENDCLFVEIAFTSLTLFSCWVINDQVIIAYDGNKKAFLRVVISE